MDFWRTVLVLFRRWYITVPAFFATSAWPGRRTPSFPVQYQSGSVLVLTTPLAGGTEATQARTSRLAHQPAAELRPQPRPDRLDRHPADEQLGDRVGPGCRPGARTSYQVTNGSTNPELLESGPFLFVQGTGPSAEAAQDITEKVSAMAAEVLAQRQDELDAPASTHITLQVVVPPTAGQPLTGSPHASGRRRRRAGRPGEPRRRLRLREPDDPPPAAPRRQPGRRTRPTRVDDGRRRPVRSTAQRQRGDSASRHPSARARVPEVAG